MIQRHTYVILITFFLFFSHIQSKVIIWDLGDTLFSTSYFIMARKVGFHHFLRYMLFDWRSPNISPILFDVLEKIDPTEEHPKEIATDNQGNPLPIIMNKWLAGIVSGKEVLKSIHDYFGHLDMQHYFISKRQKNLVFKTLEQIFNPQTLVDATHPIQEGIELLHDCYNAKTKDNKPKNSLFVLSNWDEVSFELLKERYAHIFNTYFGKNIVISGAIGFIKPKQEAFKYLINTYNLNPKECIFIDDQYDNILAAETVGMIGLLMCKGNYKTLRNILIKLDVL